LAILALALFALLAMAGLGIDVFHIYWNKNRLQAAADAGALGGATYLGNVTFSQNDGRCTYSSPAQNAACTYALVNFATPAEIISITTNPTALSVTIQMSRKVAAFFFKLLGYTQFTVYASATAALQPLSSAFNIISVGLSYSTPYAYGQPITMHSGCGSLTSPSCYGALDLTGNGGSDLRTILAQGCNCTVNVGQKLSNVPGAKAGPINQGVADRISAGQAVDPSGTWSSHTVNDPRATVVPLVDWTGCGTGECQVTVKGFAEVWITGTSGSDITAVFIQQVSSGNPGLGGLPAGALHATLIQ